nr:unnamed protein product [Callosobruchus analis]
MPQKKKEILKEKHAFYENQTP